jgi:hypothetical protein
MIRASEQNPEGKWTAPVQLAGINQSLNPTLAESQSGAAVIVWSYTQGGPGRTVIEAVTRSSPGSAWSVPKRIRGSSPLGRMEESPVLRGFPASTRDYIRPFPLLRDGVATTLATLRVSRS